MLEAAFVKLISEEQQLTVAPYRPVAEGGPVEPGRLGDLAGWTTTDIEARRGREREIRSAK